MLFEEEALDRRKCEGALNSEVTMYLDHFGLSLQPFSSLPPGRFFHGARRGETLDSLIYALTRGEGEEGIILVTGEPGSGKTILCRQLIERLPASMQVITRVKTGLSKDELLSSIAEELKIESDEPVPGRVTPAAQAPVAMCPVEDVLTRISAVGRKVVLLIDEAQALTEENLQELRLLYEQGACHDKLLQIVLFAETGFERRLRAPKMPGVKKALRHHFILQPLNAETAEEYLLWRLSLAGHRGPDIFSFAAIRLIDNASGGVMRQLDVLADKSLMAAFRADAPEVGAQHARFAIEDCGIKPRVIEWRNGRNRPDLLNDLMAGVSTAISAGVLLVFGVMGWLALESGSETTAADNTPLNPALNASLQLPVSTSSASLASVSSPSPLPVPSPAPSGVPASPYSASVAALSPSAEASVSASAPVPNAPAGTRSTGKASSTDTPSEKTAGKKSPVQSQPESAAERQRARRIAGVELAGHKLLEQRIDETLKTVAKADKFLYTIQLFDTDNIQPDRMERFLARARGLVDLSNLYVHSVTDEDRAKFVVTYGIYTRADEAKMAVSGLPEKYRSDFQPELRILSELQ